MGSIFIVVCITVALALIFDVINGFHDAANSIATIVSTRVLSPRFAVMWAAFFNFIAMFIFAPKVANTIAKIIKIDQADTAFIYVVLAGLLGAIIWDLITWWYGLPASSSHALLGGLVGAGLAYKGTSVINWEVVTKTAAFIPIAPLVGVVLGFFVMIGVIWLVHKWTPKKVDTTFRAGQLISAALYSISHGANDAQKTMGVIVAILVAGKIYTPDIELSMGNQTLWIIMACQVAMAAGTMMGGWKIVKTMGMKLTQLKPVHGFCAELAGSCSIFIATHLGIPISTTHTISGSIIGVGSVQNLAGVKWETAIRIVAAWVLTIPAAGIVSALVFWGIKALHCGF
ncbi:MAG: inorganic phosphate transporter [Bacteroidota bacterium]|nr:inorganic phosphate transporter [Bacteroidota bacterium]